MAEDVRGTKKHRWNIRQQRYSESLSVREQVTGHCGIETRKRVNVTFHPTYVFPAMDF